MDVIGFEITENVSKKSGKTYYMLQAICKDGSKYFINFVNKLKK